MRRLTIPLAFVALACCCTDTSQSSLDDLDAVHETDAPATSRDPGPRPDAPVTGEGEFHPDEGCGILYIDFPCMKYLVCVDERHYYRQKDLTCADLGYDPACCSGLTCGGDGDGSCDEDARCVSSGSYSESDACRQYECGALDDPPCAEGTMCEFATGTCGGPGERGVCVPTTPYCNELEPAWQCGCDGVSYPGTCARRAAGVSLDHDGPCCDPSRVPFDRDNPTGVLSWQACIADDAHYPAATLASMGAHVDCVPVGVSPACDAGETACRGSLDLEPGTTRPTDASFAVACAVAALPIVRVLLPERGSDCAQVAPAPAPLCRYGCWAPCGCDTCAVGRTCNAAMDGLDVCTGTCLEEHPCAAGCGTWFGEPACRLTCLESKAFYEHELAVAAEKTCDDDAGCVVLQGHCTVGLGGCWHPATNATPQAYLDALAVTWTEQGCVPQAVCDCPPAPTVRCSAEQRCVLD